MQGLIPHPRIASSACVTPTHILDAHTVCHAPRYAPTSHHLPGGQFPPNNWRWQGVPPRHINDATRNGVVTVVTEIPPVLF